MSAAFPSNVNRYTPGRPNNERDISLILNGRLTYLGVLVSSGAAVNNATTATPFNWQDSATMQTLRGKALLVQPTAAGHIMASDSASMLAPTTIVTTLSSATPAAGTAPAPKLQAEERVPFFMLPTDGWLQFIPTSGSANLFVWELS